jgi:hypothetical protein
MKDMILIPTPLYHPLDPPHEKKVSVLLNNRLMGNDSRERARDQNSSGHEPRKMFV